MSLRDRRNSFSAKIFDTARAARRFSLLLGKEKVSVLESPRDKPEIVDSKVFGVELKTAVMRSNKSHHMLPDVVYKCLIYLETKGVCEEGIFRMSGSATDILKMKEQFDQGQDYDVRSCLNPHTVAGVLKLFLRELPVPLLITDLDASEVSDVLAYTKSIVEGSPQENRYLLGCLFKLLNKISEREDVTKMGVKNLVIVFSAALHCSGTVITALIKHATLIFPENLLEKTVKINDVITENKKEKSDADKGGKKKSLFDDEGDIFGMEDDFQRITIKEDTEQSSVALVQDLWTSPVFRRKKKGQKSIFDSDDEEEGQVQQNGW